jgi:heparinase II/III-like protein
MHEIFAKIRRGFGKPPRYILERLAMECRAEAERYLGPRRARHFGLNSLLAATGADNLEHLWTRLRARPYPALVKPLPVEEYERLCPGDFERILQKSEDVQAHRVNLLGSGPVELGAEIDWHKDYKTNFSWPVHYFKDIDYCNPELPSDVKFPWEVSRMQWLIPAGKAYLLTGQEKYAWTVRGVITQWMRANPYSYGINWACTMEVALRILSWTWFFHVFSGSRAWSDQTFQQEFLSSLYMHAIFASRHLEKSDINGNHYTADAAGLVCAGLFFGAGASPRKWTEQGWHILTEELPRQVHQDGVDFEASVAYHRLVFELFLIPALYRIAMGSPAPEVYKTRLAKMAHFTAAYLRPDGTVPLWGDADDARALPLGSQEINDHRYVLGLAGCTFAPELKEYFSGPVEEIFWLLGLEAARSLQQLEWPKNQPGSTDFPTGGFYVMRSDRDHVFIDCGPMGLGNRGGHGHNDLLSFEAVVDGVHLVTDCGSYVYTADYAERNRFRSTAYHNTPLVNGDEINRFISTEDLWSFRNDAHFEVHEWKSSSDQDIFRGAHTGYNRLASPVTVIRTITLCKCTHTLTIADDFVGRKAVPIQIPLHLARGVEVISAAPDGVVHLRGHGQDFIIHWKPLGSWSLSKEPARVSLSYGTVLPITRLIWKSIGESAVSLHVTIKPVNSAKRHE